MVIVRRKPRVRLKVLAASALLCESEEENVGANADVRAPSATKLLNRFGILNATKKASAKREAPRIRATSRSRTKPKTRLSKVRRETIAVPRSSIIAPTES
jgi:hypothetical protein